MWKENGTSPEDKKYRHFFKWLASSLSKPPCYANSEKSRIGLAGWLMFNNPTGMKC